MIFTDLFEEARTDVNVRNIHAEDAALVQRAKLVKCPASCSVGGLCFYSVRQTYILHV